MKTVPFVKNHQAITPGKTLLAYDTHMFAELTGALRTGRKLPELLVVMTTVGLLNRALPLEEYLVAVIGQDWQFNAPVNIDDTIHAAYQVEDIKDTKQTDRKIVVFNIKVINQNDEQVASGKWTILIQQ